MNQSRNGGQMRQGVRRLGARQAKVRLGQTERDAEKEADAVASIFAALPTKPPLLVQEEEVVLDFLRQDPDHDPDTDYQALLVKRKAPRWIRMLRHYDVLHTLPDGTMRVRFA